MTVQRLALISMIATCSWVGPVVFPVSLLWAHDETERRAPATPSTAVPPESLATLSSNELPSIDAVVTVEQLVIRLGDPSLSVREEATDALLKTGTCALPAVREAMKSPDLEVSKRAHELCKLLRMRELEEELKSFLEHPWQETHLPTWERYEQLCGNDQASREFYAKMLKAEPALMAAIDHSPIELQRAFDNLAQEWSGRFFLLRNQAFAQATFESVAVLLYATSRNGCHPTPLAATEVLRLTKSVREEALKSPQFLAILGEFIDQSGISIYLRLDLADYFQQNNIEILFPHGVDLARKVLKLPPNSNEWAPALPKAARLGKMELIEDFEELLKSKAEVGPRRDPSAVHMEVRDYALSALFQIGKQYSKEHKAELSRVPAFPFPDEKDRQEALRQWKKFRAKAIPDRQVPLKNAFEGRAT